MCRNSRREAPDPGLRRGVSRRSGQRCRAGPAGCGPCPARRGNGGDQDGDCHVDPHDIGLDGGAPAACRSAVPVGRAWRPAMIFRGVNSDGILEHTSFPCLSCNPCAPVSLRDGAKGRSDFSGIGVLNRHPLRYAFRPSRGTVVAVRPDQPRQTTGPERPMVTSAPRPRRALTCPGAGSTGPGGSVARARETRGAFPGSAQRGNSLARVVKDFPARRRAERCFRTSQVPCACEDHAAGSLAALGACYASDCESSAGLAPVRS